MTLPSAGNPLSLLQIQAEFGGSDPIEFIEYERGGASGYVDTNTLAGATAFQTAPLVPAAGVQIAQRPAGPMVPPPTLQMSMYYDTSATIVGNSGLITGTRNTSDTLNDYQDVTLPAGVRYIRLFAVGGGGGGGGRNTQNGGNGGGGAHISGTVDTSFAGSIAFNRTLRFLIGEAGQGGLSNVQANTIVSPPAIPGHGFAMNQITSTSWGTFLQTYGVDWTFGSYESSNVRSARTLNFPVTGTYQFQFTADNYISIYLDGVLVADVTSLNDQGNTFGFSYTRAINDPLTQSVSITAGFHKLTFIHTNGGSVGAYGVRILDPSSAELWTTRYDQGWNGTPSGGFGGLAGNEGASGQGGGGGSATRISIINNLGQEYPLVIAGGGGGGGGGGDFAGNNSANGNWMCQGWSFDVGFPSQYPGGGGDYSGGINNGEFGFVVTHDGGGGGGGGGGIPNLRQYVQTVNKQWVYSGFGGRTFRGNADLQNYFPSMDRSGDGGECGKSWRTPWGTWYADFVHAATTVQYPIVPAGMPVSFPYGVGGAGSASGSLPGTAGTSGAGYVDWGLTNPSVPAPTVVYDSIQAGAVCYLLLQFDGALAACGPNILNLVGSEGSAASFVIDGFGGGGRPGTEYTYSWSVVSGDTPTFTSPNSYRTVVNTPIVPVAPIDTGYHGIGGVIRVTVADGFSSATKDFTWSVWAESAMTPPSGG